MVVPSIHITTLPHAYYLLLSICCPVLEAYNFDFCLHQHQVIENQPFLQFSIQPDRTCWEYCRYLKNCTALSFKLGHSGLCTLYDEEDLKYSSTSFERNETIYSGEKTCLRKADADAELARMFGNTTRRVGAYIQNAETGGCLAVSPVPRYTGDRTLVWKPDCVHSTQWLIERVTSKTSQYTGRTNTGTLVRIRDKETRNCITVTNVRCQSAMCLLAIIRECSHKDVAYQTFLMHGLHTAPYTLMIPNDYRYIVTEISNNPLDEIHHFNRFTLIQGDLPCAKLNLTHGSVLVDPSQPLYVPGEKISVLCDIGYGVKTEGRYVNYVTTVCSNELVAPQCVITSTGSGGDTDMIRMPTLTFYSVMAYIVLAGLLLVMYYVTSSLRRFQKVSWKKEKLCQVTKTMELTTGLATELKIRAGKEENSEPAR